MYVTVCPLSGPGHDSSCMFPDGYRFAEIKSEHKTHKSGQPVIPCQILHRWDSSPLCHDITISYISPSAARQVERRGHLSDLFTKELRVTTCFLWIIWFADTFCYYGIVLLTTELLDIQGEATCQGMSHKNNLLWYTNPKPPG